MEEQTDNLLTVTGVSKSFGGVKALDAVDFSIRKGEIHCLAGENGSGKSTLIKVVAGVIPPDAGEIAINGHVYRHLHAIDAIRNGIQVIYQDLSLFPKLSVAENIAINQLIGHRRRLVSRRDFRSIARAQLRKVGVDMGLGTRLEDLSIANRQIVAICRALSLDARLLIMDEPTSALTRQEVDRLLAIVHELKGNGISILFVSHKLDEDFSIADRITVLRDGRKVGVFAAGALSMNDLVYQMTGKVIEYVPYVYRKDDEEKPPVLEVKRLSKAGDFEGVSFTVSAGEIVGLTGLLGSGRTELALSLFGLNKPDSGEISLEGKKATFTSPEQAISLGISLLPEDRHTEGLFLRQTIEANISATILSSLRTRWGAIDEAAKDRICNSLFSNLRIKASSIRSRVQELSGGNQQKVVLSKWVATNPKLFILDSPTMGIDIASKSEIYARIHELASRGMAILLISDEIPEILNNCTRILVMRAGKITHDVPIEKASEDILRELIAGQETNPAANRT
jgi:simple sugar transport system ATP-binding protein